MPWREVTVMQEKAHFIERYLKKDCSMSELCKEFLISRRLAINY